MGVAVLNILQLRFVEGVLGPVVGQGGAAGEMAVFDGGAGRDDLEDACGRKMAAEARVAVRVVFIEAHHGQNASAGGLHDDDRDVPRSALVQALRQVVLQGAVDTGLDHEVFFTPAHQDAFFEEVLDGPVDQQILDVGFGKQGPGRGIHGGRHRAGSRGWRQGRVRLADGEPQDHQESGQDTDPFQRQRAPESAPAPALELRLVVAPAGAPPVFGGLVVRTMELHRSIKAYHRPGARARWPMPSNAPTGFTDTHGGHA